MKRESTTRPWCEILSSWQARKFGLPAATCIFWLNERVGGTIIQLQKNDILRRMGKVMQRHRCALP